MSLTSALAVAVAAGALAAGAHHWGLHRGYQAGWREGRAYENARASRDGYLPWDRVAHYHQGRALVLWLLNQHLAGARGLALPPAVHAELDAWLARAPRSAPELPSTAVDDCTTLPSSTR